MSTPDEALRHVTRKPLYISAAASAAVVVAASIGWYLVSDIPEDQLLKLEHVGAFVGGISSVITIIWLIATLLMQLDELGLQRAELFKQRQAWDAASVAIRGQVVLAMRPTFLIRLAAQANALAKCVYADFKPDALTPLPKIRG